MKERINIIQQSNEIGYNIAVKFQNDEAKSYSHVFREDEEKYKNIIAYLIAQTMKIKDKYDNVQ